MNAPIRINVTLLTSAPRDIRFKQPSIKKIDAYDSYVSDPSKPVPYTARITDRVPPEYMVEDQRFAAKRPDVLVYESEILTDDITITARCTGAGPGAATSPAVRWIPGASAASTPMPTKKLCRVVYEGSWGDAFYKSQRGIVP